MYNVKFYEVRINKKEVIIAIYMSCRNYNFDKRDDLRRHI